MINLYDPTKSVQGFKRSVLEQRYKDLIDIVRANGIYRNIVIPEFVFLQDKFYSLHIYYPTEEHGYRTTGFEISNNNGYLFLEYLDDDEFVKVVDSLDGLVDGDIDEYLDELYYEIDDEDRINQLKEKISHEDPLA